MSDIAYYVGILIVLLTHVWIIVKGGMPESMSVGHSYLNLAAAFLIAFNFVQMKSALKQPLL